MDNKKNTTSLLFGVPGILLQFGGLFLGGFLTAANVSPQLASIVSLGGLLLGTALLMVGIAYYAMAKGHSPVWCLMAFLGIIGLIVLALLPDRHGHAGRVRNITSKVSDTPTAQSPAFQCPACDYQLNGIPGSECPECGRAFNPDDLTTVKVQGIYTEPVAPWQGRWSLICGIVGIALFPLMICGPIVGIIGLVFGYSARTEIKRQALPGSGVALAGLITSYIAIGLSLCCFLGGFVLPQLVDTLAPR